MGLSKISPPRWSDVTAIFGGRFDPPHLGHREAVRGLFLNPGIRQVLVVPSASPPHKPITASIEHRLAMVERNFLASPGFQWSWPVDVKIEDCEIRRHALHPNQPSYTFDTLSELKRRYSQLAFVIGTDQLSQLHRWHRFPELLSLAHWIVLERASASRLSSELATQTLQDWSVSGLARAVQPQVWQLQSGPTFMIMVPTNAPNLSSTDIREGISRLGTPPESALLPSVAEYLMLSQLYGIRTSSK